jgi:ribonuclease P/MRP protein subunit RPP1
MKRTDACLFPYPEGDTSLRRFALEARGLGYDAIVCIGADKTGAEYGVEVLRGVMIREPSMRAATNRVRRCHPEREFVMVAAGDAAFNRAILAYPGVHSLCALHSAQKRAFDHVAARTAAEKGVAVDICLAPLVHQTGGARQRVLGVYADILRLNRRYGFPLTISSGARSCLDLRSVRAVIRLC